MKIPALRIRPTWTFLATLARLAACPLLLVTLPLARGGVIGVNYNGQFENYNQTDLATTQTLWVRGFINYFDFKNGVRDLNTDPGLAALHTAHLAGYKTIVSIKFDYSNMRFPTSQSGRDSALTYMPTLLAKIYGDCDTIVGGNEPFIESEIDNRGPNLRDFYESVANSIHNFENGQTRKVPIYVGAFNNLWESAWQTQTTADLLAFVKANSWLAGIDLHIHHTLASDITGAFNYASPKILGTQKIIVTEFSLVKLWNQHMNDLIPTQLATQYGRDPSWADCDYVTFTLGAPVSRAEWVVWLSNSPWFETNKNYLTTTLNTFSSYAQFNMCTYGLYQTQAGFACGDMPWILNPLFVNQTVVWDPATGRPQGNYSFLDTFKLLAH